ncbi:hypothetical protein ACFL9T_07400 [Thermodesulfobacteriota bacterium]
MQVSNISQTVQFSANNQNFTRGKEFTQSTELTVSDTPRTENLEIPPKIDPEVKEMATEMLPQDRRMGEFKDKNWVEEAKDLQIGPDIRFAVKSKNPDFLNRIVWGPLTAAEFREVTHRLRELERMLTSEGNNVLPGRIIDLDA